jgi:hypothetical protein
MAVRSAVTKSTTWPTALLPSLACQVGPAKWVMMSLPWSSYRFARGATKPQTKPLEVALQEEIWTPIA